MPPCQCPVSSTALSVYRTSATRRVPSSEKVHFGRFPTELPCIIDRIRSADLYFLAFDGQPRRGRHAPGSPLSGTAGKLRCTRFAVRICRECRSRTPAPMGRPDATPREPADGNSRCSREFSHDLRLESPSGVGLTLRRSEPPTGKTRIICPSIVRRGNLAVPPATESAESSRQSHRGTMASDGRCDALGRSARLQGALSPPGVRIPTRGKWGILLDPC